MRFQPLDHGRAEMKTRCGRWGGGQEVYIMHGDASTRTILVFHALNSFGSSGYRDFVDSNIDMRQALIPDYCVHGSADIDITSQR